MASASGFLSLSHVERSFIKSQPEETVGDFIRLGFGGVVNDVVTYVSFCPHEWQSMLFAVATCSDIHIFKVPITDQQLECGEPLNCSHVCSFSTKSSVVALSWSPETSVNSPVKVIVVAALQGGGVKLCSWNGETRTAGVQDVGGHKGCVNDVHVDPGIGEMWASVGDDNLLNVHDMKGEIKHQRLLRTAGRMVRFVPDNVLVIELGGTVRFYDLQTLQPTRALFAQSPPIIKVDCVKDSIACVNATGALYIYSGATTPKEFKNPSLTVSIKLSPAVGFWCAVAENTGFRVLNTETGQVIKQRQVNAVRGICWHPERPLLAVAFENQVDLFRVQ